MESSTTKNRPSEESSDGDWELNYRPKREARNKEDTQRAISVGVVIPAAPNRLDNVRKAIQSLDEGEIKPKEIVVICDGFMPDLPPLLPKDMNGAVIPITKHRPGLEQPRNQGVKHLHESDYVWFLDSDCVVNKNTLSEYIEAIEVHPEADVFFGPYNPNMQPEDERLPMFRESNLVPEQYHLGYALGNWAGNLIWRIASFKEIGGFHPDLNMGRCEDGELGLRAAELGMIMVPVLNAGAVHLDHERNAQQIVEKNNRDVTLIHQWHGWVENEGLRIIDADGKRLERICPECDELINTGEWWAHEEKHRQEVQAHGVR